jgi:hypothetical protein
MEGTSSGKKAKTAWVSVDFTDFPNLIGVVEPNKAVERTGKSSRFSPPLTAGVRYYARGPRQS